MAFNVVASSSDDKVYMARSLDDWLITQLASRAEAHFARVLQHELPNFVQGSEGAMVDCGVVLGSSSLTYHDNSSRLASALKLYPNEEAVVLPLDVKCSGPRFPAKLSLRGDVFFGIAIGSSQRCTAAFLVWNPAFPRLAAMIPHYFIDQSWPDERETAQKFYSGSITVRPDGIFPAFPPEWWPFVMPMETLPEAVRQLCGFQQGLEKNWKNPHNNVVFEGCPRPKLQKTPILLTHPRAKSDYPVIDKIRDAFETYSATYRVAQSHIRPSVGDFYIIHKTSGQRAVVELKRGLSKVRGEDTICHSPTSLYGSPLFTALTQWDVLLTTRFNDPNTFFFLPKDELPAEWFVESAVHQKMLEWQAGREYLSRHTVTWEGAQDFVVQAEKVLDGIRLDGTFKSAIQYPHNKVSCKVLLDEQIEDAEEVEVIGRSKTNADVLRGTGSTWTPSDWLAQQQDWLERECDKSGFGWVYALGKYHPSGLTVLVPHKHDGSPRPDFCELPPQYPLVFINFVEVMNIFRVTPQSDRRVEPFFHAVHGYSPSLYVITALTEEDQHLPQGRYLVPTESLLTSSLVDRYEGRITVKASNIYLRDGEAIDCYYAEEGELIPRIRDMFTQPLTHQDHQFHMGDGMTQCGATIDLSKYVLSQRDAVEQFIPQILQLSEPQNRRGKKGK